MHVPQHRRDLRTRWAGADLGDGDGTVGAAEPLHVRQAVADAQRPHRGGPDLGHRAVARVVELAGEQHRPLDPRGPQHLQRRGPVVRDGRPHRLPADLHAVERVLVADEELLQQTGRVRARRDRREPAAQGVGLVEAVGGLRPRARGWLRDQREPDRLRKGERFARLPDELVARARHPRRGEHLLHPRLVAHVVRGVDVQPRDAQRLTGVGERHLQLLQRADQPLDGPELPRQPGDRLGDLARVQRVVDPPVPGQVPRQLGGNLLGGRGGDQAEPHAGQLRGRGDEPHGGGHEERCDERGRDLLLDHGRRRYRRLRSAR